jgi:hypothetical protein
MKTYKAQIGFHFWGQYAETLVISVPTSPKDAETLRDHLLRVAPLSVPIPNAAGGLAPPRWMLSASGGVLARYSGDDIKLVHDALIRMGAPAKTMTSMAKSIDRGPTFEIHFKED